MIRDINLIIRALRDAEVVRNKYNEDYYAFHTTVNGLKIRGAGLCPLLEYLHVRGLIKPTTYSFLIEDISKNVGRDKLLFPLDKYLVVNRLRYLRNISKKII